MLREAAMSFIIPKASRWLDFARYCARYCFCMRLCVDGIHGMICACTRHYILKINISTDKYYIIIE